jgi:hypothetical protein
MNTELLELTEQEKRIVRERLGVSERRVTRLLLAASRWARKNTTPEEFESRFPEFIAAYKLNPAIAEVATNYVLSFVDTASDEEHELDERCKLMLVSGLDKTNEEDWEAFMGHCKKAHDEATASERLLVHNIAERGVPTTQEEIEEALALAHLREWVCTQIQ